MSETIDIAFEELELPYCVLAGDVIVAMVPQPVMVFCCVLGGGVAGCVVGCGLGSFHSVPDPVNLGRGLRLLFGLPWDACVHTLRMSVCVCVRMCKHVCVMVCTSAPL